MLCVCLIVIHELPQTIWYQTGPSAYFGINCLSKLHTTIIFNNYTSLNYWAFYYQPIFYSVNCLNLFLGFWSAYLFFIRNSAKAKSNSLSISTDCFSFSSL